jgi:hypothetical protein
VRAAARKEAGRVMTLIDRLLVRPRRTRTALGTCAVLMMFAVVAVAGAQPALTQAHGDRTDRHAPLHHASYAGVDGRVQLMTKALALDTRQQVELRKILLDQKAAVTRVWADESTPAALRVAATSAIGDQTGDRIRSMLTDDQKKLYSLPKSEHQMPADPSSRSVEDWMRAANPNRPAQSLGGTTASQ